MKSKLSAVVLILLVLALLPGCGGSIKSQIDTSFTANHVRVAYIVENRSSNLVQNEYSLGLGVFVNNGTAMPMPVLNVKDGYIYPSEKRGETERNIAAALQKYDIQAVTGPEDSKPENADIIIKYIDKWKWDLAWYLAYLKITFHDSNTGAELASGEFTNSEIHSFQNPSREVPKIIDAMMSRGR